MRIHPFLAVSILPLLFLACTQPPAGGGGGGGGGDNNAGTGGGGGGTGAVNFTSGGVALEAATTNDADGQTTSIVRDGATLVRMRTTLNDLHIAFPTQQGNDETVIEFNTPLAGVPSDFALNRLATLIAADAFLVPDESRPDSPGCDWFPDTRCTLRCCADHDRCFAENNCGASSWLPLIGSAACDNCNSIVSRCILDACENGTEGDPDSDVCFDAACRMSYTCPDFNCDCTSPCAPPSSCGNGTCEVTEDAENCQSDCATGLGLNICCLESDNCPTETAYTCPGGCCCCGLGETCAASSLCAPSSVKVRLESIGSLEDIGPEAKRRLTSSASE